MPHFFRIHNCTLLTFSANRNPRTEFLRMKGRSFRFILIYFIFSSDSMFFVIMTDFICVKSKCFIAKNESLCILNSFMSKSMDCFLYDRDLRHEKVRSTAKEKYVKFATISYSK